MIKSFIDILKNLNSKTVKIMHYGFLFSLILCIFSLLMLLFYNLFEAYPFLFEYGISVLKLSFFICIEFIICGIVVDSISKQKI